MNDESTQPTTRRPHVVVLGGGYAGALAANRLQQNPDVDITVVNPRPKFVHRVRLHELVAGSGEATLDLADMLGENVRLVVGTVDKIDAHNRSVELENGASLTYDFLILATGSTGVVPATVPGADEYAYPLAELEQAQRLRSVLDRTPADAQLCVVGGGLTGIEAAAELAEQRRDATIVLLCGGILAPTLGDKARSSIRRQLKRLKVQVEEGGMVAEVEPERVRLTDGRVLAAAATVWTAGFGVPDLATRSGLRTDSMGRLLTDETMTSLDDPRIFAAGDAAAPSNQPLRMSCQAAMPLAARAADTVLDLIGGKQPTALAQSFVGTNISIGRRYGTIQLSRGDDTPRGMYVGGKAAAVIKEQVCRMVVKQIAKESRKPGSYSWPGAKKQPTSGATTVA